MAYQSKHKHHLRTPIARLRADLKASELQIEGLREQAELLRHRLQQATLSSVGDASERLSALMLISSALLVTHDVDVMIQALVRESVHLFPGIHAALIFLFNVETGLLELRAAGKNQVPFLQVRVGQGATGRAYLAQGAIFMGGSELMKVRDELSEDQIAAFQEIVNPWPPINTLLAPMRTESERVGVLLLCGNADANQLHPRDLPFAQALADLATAAILEYRAVTHAQALQADLLRSQMLHAEARERLDTAQAQLLQSAKLAAVGELAASVAHEINNPLYAARNSLYLLEQDLTPDSAQTTFLRIAQDELGRIARIITRMRDFYRPSRQELEPVNINELLNATIELVRTHMRHGHVRMSADLVSDLPMMTAHADQIRQVFLNLMLNACDAMPNGGRLHVSTAHVVDQADHERVEVAIRDTGTGIASEHQPHIFEPFYTTKANGTGLGLAISAHIVSQHGGTIALQSELNVGTTFTITLPLDNSI